MLKVTIMTETGKCIKLNIEMSPIDEFILTTMPKDSDSYMNAEFRLENIIADKLALDCDYMSEVED